MEVARTGGIEVGRTDKNREKAGSLVGDSCLWCTFICVCVVAEFVLWGHDSRSARAWRLASGMWMVWQVRTVLRQCAVVLNQEIRSMNHIPMHHVTCLPSTFTTILIIHSTSTLSSPLYRVVCTEQKFISHFTSRIANKISHGQAVNDLRNKLSVELPRL